LDDFEIVQNCTREIIGARKFATNWESLFRADILKKRGIVVGQGQESIRRDYGIRVGDFPVILFRIHEFFALNFFVFPKYNRKNKHLIRPLPELFAGKFHKFLCPIRQ
jgi:hypothetical protein